MGDNKGEHIRVLLKQYDTNHDLKLQHEEIEKMVADYNDPENRERLPADVLKALQSYDTDHNKFLDVNEVKRVQDDVVLIVLKSVAGAGIAAMMAALFCHPIDLVKTRLQVSGDGKTGVRNYRALGITGTVSIIAKEEGMSAFYKGIGAALLREASYTSLRLGLYAPIKKAFGVTKDSSIFMKFAAGSAAGAIGSLVGNPFDVLKTRMMASEGTTSLPQNAGELYKQQGISGFYRGIQANILRAMVLNGTKMSCYDTVKKTIKETELIPDGIPTQFAAAFAAGFFMASTVAPFDVIRTLLMNQPSDKKVYTGFSDCAVKVFKQHGVGGFYRGFVPIWARFAPATTLQLVIFEQIKPLFGLTSLE